MLLADGGVARGGDGGGGGGGSPTSSTAYNTNVPEYARPYVENMLQSTQKQIYNDDMTSFRPYQPYSRDVNNYFADYSPMQKQAQYETANLQTPGQFEMASGLTGAGALRSIGAGQQYANNVTDPSSMQAYMNPYQQGVTDVAKSAAVREAMIAENANKLSSARQGTYGGARQLLGSTERERNLLSNLSNIQTQGSDKAYNQALQSQQFGANLGLQGYNQAMQGGSQLANIGGQQQAADLARINAQNTMGSQQQSFEQQKINQAISNYATEQQYPFMQLGIMNSMVRGLPLQQTTTSTYQQQPSTTQQLAGLGGAALSYMGGKKEGGVIGMKEGGTVPGFKYGDLISDPQLQGMSQNLSPDQIQGRIADPQVTPNERGIFQGTQQAQQRMASNPMAAQTMAQAAPPPQMAQAPSGDARMGGIAAAGGDMFNTMGYAGGGIIAFAGGDVVEEKPKTREEMLAQTQELMRKQGFEPGATAEEKANAALIAKRQAGLGDVTEAERRANRATAFLKAGANPRGFLPGAIEGAESYLVGEGKIASNAAVKELSLSEANAKHAAGMRARAAGDIAASDKLFEEEAKLRNQANIAKGNNAATIQSAQIHASAAGQAGRQEEAKVEAYLKDNPGATRSQAYAAVAQFSRGESNDISRMKAADEVLSKDLNYYNLRNSDDPKDIAKADKIRDTVYKRYGVIEGGAPPVAPAPVQNKDGTITIPGKGTFRAVDGGYQKVG